MSRGEVERKVPEDGSLTKLVPADDETLLREAATILLAFKRYSQAQVAAILQVGIERVIELGSDPEVQSAIDGLTSLLPRPGEINELLMSDAERNIKWMRDVREGRVDGQRLGADDKTLRVRADMAKALLSVQVAKKVDIAVKEIRAIDITPIQRERISKLLEAPIEVEASATPKPEPKSLLDAEFD